MLRADKFVHGLARKEGAKKIEEEKWGPSQHDSQSVPDKSENCRKAVLCKQHEHQQHQSFILPVKVVFTASRTQSLIELLPRVSCLKN